MGWSRRSKIAVAAAVGATIGAGAFLASCDSVLGIGGFTFGSCEHAGDHRCMGNQLEVCSEHGSWAPAQVCEGQACSADAGACVGSCTPNKERCSPDSGVKLELCSAEGQWQFQSNCTYVCANDQCGGECVPDASTCSHGDNKPSDYGSTIMTCGPDGHWIPMPHPCVNGMPTDCEPSTARCITDTQTQPCGDAGSWLDLVDCGAPQECFYNTGACDTPCKPGIDAKRCHGKDIQSCESVASGGGVGSWVDAGSCEGPCSDCNAGSCVNTPAVTCKANCIKSGVCDDGGTCVPDPDGGKVECVFVPLDAGICSPLDCDPSAGTCQCNLDSGACGAPDTPPGQPACTTGDSCVTSGWCQAGACSSNEQPNHQWAHWHFPSSPPGTRYFKTAEVVYDQVTHLTWQRVTGGAFPNDQAATYCACLNSPPPTGTDCTSYPARIAGYPQGWRLPTRIELASLVLYDKPGVTPLIDTSLDVAPGVKQFWSASTESGGSAWTVDFNSGHVTLAPVGTFLPIRCVR